MEPTGQRTNSPQHRAWAAVHSGKLLVVGILLFCIPKKITKLASSQNFSPHVWNQADVPRAGHW